MEGAADLRVLAECAGSDFETLRLLNPALRRYQTPPHATTSVHVPPGEHTFTIAVRPRSVLLGLAISLITAAGMGVWLLMKGIRWRRCDLPPAAPK